MEKEKETWESAYRTLKFQLDLSAEEETYLNDFVRILLTSQKEKMLGVLDELSKLDEKRWSEYSSNPSYRNCATDGYFTAVSDIKKKIKEEL